MPIVPRRPVLQRTFCGPEFPSGPSLSPDPLMDFYITRLSWVHSLESVLMVLFLTTMTEPPHVIEWISSPEVNVNLICTKPSACQPFENLRVRRCGAPRPSATRPLASARDWRGCSEVL